MMRVFYVPYMVIGWYLTVMTTFVVLAAVEKQYLFSLLCMITVNRVFFPAMTFLYGESDNVAEVIVAELMRRSLPSTVAKNTATLEARVEGQISDVWLRLFRCRWSTFTLTSLELALIIECFEKSFDEEYSYLWHNDLQVSGNANIHSIYLTDINLNIDDRLRESHGRLSTDPSERADIVTMSNRLTALHDKSRRMSVSLHAESINFAALV